MFDEEEVGSGCDRVEETDGHTFYGYDDGEGYTSWYDSNGDYEGETPTPSDDDIFHLILEKYN